MFDYSVCCGKLYIVSFTWHMRPLAGAPGLAASWQFAMRYLWCLERAVALMASSPLNAHLRDVWNFEY